MQPNDPFAPAAPTAGPAPDPWARIAERAAPLFERLRGGWPADAPDAGRARLERWRRTAASDHPDRFARRLAWDGLGEDEMLRALGASAPATAGPLPAWAETMAEAYGRSRTELDARFGEAWAEPDRAVDADAPLPFETLLLPLVRVARERLRAARGPLAGEAGAAIATLERALLERLCRICERALFTQFSVRRSVVQQMGGASLFGVATGAGELFDGFIGTMRRGGMLEFWNEHAVAARLCGTVAELWAHATAEFLGHLRDDRAELQALLGGGAPLGGVRALRCDLSDPHHGARAVVVVEFASGVRAVYKPRPLGFEALFAGLVRWLNAGRPGLDLRAPRVLCRPGHGWLEFVDHAPCADLDAVERFYHRAGALLCVAYVLNGSDFHLENLIACGEHPVLIDMEGLFGHRFVLPEVIPSQLLAGAEAQRRMTRSVLSTRMLPTLRIGDDGRADDTGALGAGMSFEGPVGVREWMDVNRDGMRQGVRRMDAAPPGRNLPLLDGVPVPGNRFVDAIARGFEEAYRDVLARRGELAAPHGPLAAARGQGARFILRNTSLYGQLLERCLHPQYLRDGRDRSVELDVLSRAFLSLESPPPVWALVAEERASLEQMDVPFFEAVADSEALPLADGTRVPRCFDRAALDEAHARLAALDPDDLAFQLQAVRGAYAACAVRGLGPAPAPAPRRADAAAPRAAAWDADAARDEAARLGREVMGMAIGGSWFGMGYHAVGRRYVYGPMPHGVFDGYGGVALFLAALHHAGAGVEFETAARDALAPLRTRLGDLERAVSGRRQVALGAGTGLGSAVYALTRCAGLLGDDALLRDAARVAALVTPRAIGADTVLGMLGGAAGAVPGLLALHGATGAEAPLRAAAECGAHLLGARATSRAHGLRYWPTLNGAPEPGLAHGHAGITLALYRLAAATGDDALREAADEGVAMERAMLAGQDERRDAAAASAPWGQGPVGIALARLAAPACTPESCAEIAGALGAAGSEAVDGACAGALGRVELAITASVRLDRPDLVARARRDAARVAADARARGGYRCGWGHDAANPGLFQGLSGIGYQLLRAADPGLPAVLTWS
ncbi:MAG TPA: type 2 lanthipeptide synthetase LanM family protein [Longimicrobium sp.]|nr:type 2 lanthipeptide synthetase LanM family protein [Longimicrobium sp.]